MGEGLEELLILSSQAESAAKIAKLRLDMLEAARLAGQDSEQNRTVVEVLRSIRERGDEAVAGYTEKFDRVSLSPSEFRISADELARAHASIDPDLLATLRQAIENVRIYQDKIFLGRHSAFSEGTGIRYAPIRRAGVCVPGASAPLPSTVIMTVVPAQVAGVKEIAVVSPPRCEGSIHPVILAVCHELGVEEVYRIGGVQAVGAGVRDTEHSQGGYHRRAWQFLGPGGQEKRCG